MKILAILAIEPNHISFGRLRRGTQYPEKYASLIGLEKNNTQILSATSRNKNVKVETGVFKTEDGIEKQIKVTLLPEMKMGSFSEPINIETDHEKIKDLKLYISGEIIGDIILNSRFISFGAVRRGGKYERSIRLTAAPGITFKVLDVHSTVPGIHTKVQTIREGIYYRISACIEEDFSEDSMNGKIIITTDDKSQATIEVGILGKVFDVKSLEPPTPGGAREK